jgi:predicted permease
VEVIMNGLLNDFRHSFRMLLRTPLLSLVAVVTIGLGVGATSWAFSFLYAVLLRGLPVRDADRLMIVRETRPARGENNLLVPIHDYLAFRDQQTNFEHLAAGSAGTINLAGDAGPPERYVGAFVSARMLSMLGVPPLHGRTFVDGDDRPGTPALVVLGHAVWSNRFGSDPGAVGRPVRVNGETATIIGVMPEGFKFPANQDLWVPLRTDPQALPRRGGSPLIVTGYLRRGVPRDAAAAEAAAIASRLAAEFPQNQGIGADVRPYAETFIPSQISALTALMMVVGAGVLFVACTNVANLLMARAVVREKEVAIRGALGARRWRIVRQLLLEAVAVGIAGGLVGLALARIGMNLAGRLPGADGRPYWIQFDVDTPVLVFTTMITLLAAIAAGTLPALRASGGALAAVIRDENRGASSLRVGRFSTMLVVGELAVSCALMIATGLLIRALIDLRRLDPGFDAAPVMTARLGLFEADYPDADARNRFYHRLLERVAGERSVAAATLTTNLPATSQARVAVQVAGQSYARETDVPATGAITISPGFFDTFGVPILEGRDFRPDESHRGAEPVVVVNRSFAEERFGGREVLGSRIRIDQGDADQPWMRIIGIVPDLYEGVGDFGGGGRLRQMIYQPLGLADPRFVSLAVRTSGSPADSVSDLRRAVADVDPNLPLYFLSTMSQTLEDSIWLHRTFGILFAIFGGAALLLTAVGLYGVIDFSVSSRLREMGVRMALGAEPRHILAIVFRRVLIQLGIGVAIGLALGALLARPLASALFGVQSWDAIVYGTIVGTLVLTALAAALVPAVRAVRVDPVIAFRV